MADKKAYAREVGREAVRNGGRRNSAVRTVEGRAKSAAQKKNPGRGGMKTVPLPHPHVHRGNQRRTRRSNSTSPRG